MVHGSEYPWQKARTAELSWRYQEVHSRVSGRLRVPGRIYCRAGDRQGSQRNCDQGMRVLQEPRSYMRLNRIHRAVSL